MAHAPKSQRVFGVQEEGVSYRIRPASYAVILDKGTHVACVAEASGLFLPGGGLELGEDAVRAVHREVAEECARELQIIVPLEPAIQFFSTAMGEAYELHASFFLGCFGDSLDVAPQHELSWHPVTPHLPALYHECHRWAVQQALQRAAT